MQKMRVIFSFLIFMFLLPVGLHHIPQGEPLRNLKFSSHKVFGAEILQDKQEIFKAKVIEILDEGVEENDFIDKELFYQEIQARILDGDEKDKIVTFKNDFVKLDEGQKFFLLKVTRADDGRVSYVMHNVDRLPWIIFFTLLFIGLVVLFGGWPGIRGLLALLGGMLLIFYLLLPQIVAGASPIVMSIVVASLIVVVGSYITHGINKTTTSAVVGMVITVIITGILAYFSVVVTELTGMDNEEAIYLSLNTFGAIDLRGLLMGGIIIGLLGALYDSAIAQSIAVEELWRANPNLSKKYVLKRALRIGREHIGALVNTLAIAYVGAALPLLVLFSFPVVGNMSSTFLINRELFATEIIRTIIGSIGLVLAVPITTGIAVFMLHGTKWDTKDHEEYHAHVHTHKH